MKHFKAEREAWLAKATGVLAKTVFKDAGYKLPDNIRVSTGWPLGTRGGKGLHAIGQCFPAERSADGHFEIFISPELDDTARVLDVLIHEIVHVVAGLDAKHGPDFKKIAVACGLTGKMTATVASDGLKKKLADLVKELGKYPHAKLDGSRGSDRRPKQPTYMIKLTCPTDGYVIRTTKKWIDEIGYPTCPCGHEFEGDVPDEDGDE